MAIIGIDLGAKNSLICTYQDEETILIPNYSGNFFTPSIVNITQEGYILIGSMAKDKLILDQENTVSNFKSYLGTEHEFILQGKPYKAYELYSFILKQLKNDATEFLKQEIDRVTISVPVYFDELKRNDIKKACNLAGLTVDYFINDPCASALSFIDSEVSRTQFLILDFGGSFTATVVDFYRDLIELVSSSNDTTISGDIIDNAIADYFFEQTGIIKEDLELEEILQLHKQFEMVKKQVNVTVVFEGESVLYNKEILKEICEPIFNKLRIVISKALDFARLSPSFLSDIVLTGGVANFEVFQDYIEELFKKPPTLFENPQTFVINGVTLHNALKTDNILNINLTDLSPHNIGVSMKNIVGKDDVMNLMISKDMPLPIMRTKRFYPSNISQKKVTFQICKGDNYYTKDNIVTGLLEIELPVMLNGRPYIDLTFYYGIDDVLEIRATTIDERVYTKVIYNEDLISSESQLQKQLEVFSNLKSSELNDRLKSLINRLEILYPSVNFDKKHKVDEWFALLETLLNSKRTNQIAKNIIEIETLVEELEKSMIITIENDIFSKQPIDQFDYDNENWNFPDEDDEDIFLFDIFEELDDNDEFDGF